MSGRPSGPRRRVYLIRHGQQDAENREGELQGPLTELGRRQARRTAGRLAGLPIVSIQSSDMLHAEQTATTLGRQFPAHPIEHMALLRECVPSIPPGREADAPFAHIDPATIPQMQDRISTVFEAVFATPTHPSQDLVVTHGNLIRALVVRLVGAQQDAWLDMESRNCSITTIDVYGDGRRILVGFNDVSHLEDELRTYV